MSFTLFHVVKEWKEDTFLNLNRVSNNRETGNERFTGIFTVKQVALGKIAGSRKIAGNILNSC